MSQQGVLSVNTSGAAVVETLSSEGGPATPPNGHNFNFSGSVAGGSATNGAIHFTTPGGPGAATNGQMDANVLVDNTTIQINGSNQLHVIGGVFSEKFTVDAFTAPGTNPVVPSGAGNINVTGGQVAAGTTANVIRTDSLAANTYTIEIQRSQAVASTTIGDNGVSHFNSASFTVDANGFVSLVPVLTYPITNINHASSPYTVLSTDQFISADVTAGVITVRLPNTTTTGRVIIIKDKVGLCNTSNISLTTVGGVVTIDGQTTYTMNVNYESISLIFDGTNYEVF